MRDDERLFDLEGAGFSVVLAKVRLLLWFEFKTRYGTVVGSEEMHK
jgi:hypothetical protein